MGWWDRVVFPMRRVWIGFATRLKIRKTGRAGLWRLHQEVSTCEYEDVRVMWEMLSRTDTGIGRPHRTARKRHVWAVLAAPFNLCRTF